MEQLIQWLKKIEEYAARLYGEAATLFPEDARLVCMLNELARDEDLHFHIMGSAADYLRTQRLDPKPAVVLDDQVIARVELPFAENLRKLSRGTLTARDMVECIASSEYSEWNDIFLYVVNTLKEHSKSFQFGASMMQHHIDKIETFLDTIPDEQGMLQELRRLPPVWRHHILVVDDDTPVRELMRAFLERRAVVDTAENGALALERIQGRFYDAIVTDIEMPIMNGIELFRHATSQDPNLRHRFLFSSGGDTSTVQGFLRTHEQPFMPKPFSLSELGNAVQGLLDHAARTPTPFDAKGGP